MCMVVTMWQGREGGKGFPGSLAFGRHGAMGRVPSPGVPAPFAVVVVMYRRSSVSRAWGKAL